MSQDCNRIKVPLTYVFDKITLRAGKSETSTQNTASVARSRSDKPFRMLRIAGQILDADTLHGVHRRIEGGNN